MTYPGLVRASWDRSVKRLWLRAHTPHDLRRKWATLTLMNGAVLHKGSRWFGHRSLKVTVDRYGHLAQDDREHCRQVVTTTFQDHLREEMPVHFHLTACALTDSEFPQDPVLTWCRVHREVEVTDAPRTALDLPLRVVPLGP